MYPIQLPSYNIELKDENQQTYIFDVIRKKYLVLTPEEWVRQHFIHLLINQYGYPKGLFCVERGHKYNNLQKRTDIIVLDRDGEIDLLVECKAHTEKINSNTMTQIMNYNLTLNSKKIIVTNGISTFCFQNLGEGMKQVKDVPKYV